MTQNSPQADYGQMLLDGIDEVRHHLAEWGREVNSDAANLASGYVVSLLSEEILRLKRDPERLALMNTLAPAMLAAVREMREAEQTCEGGC